MKEVISAYINDLHKFFNQTQVTDNAGREIDLSEAILRATEAIMKANALGRKVIFIGNGGSAAVASHKALDYWFTGKIRGIAFTDHANLTCVSNDFGYQNVFVKQLEMFADGGDILIAISSSGNSENIVLAAEEAKHRGCSIFTFSGFKENNRLRNLGDLNFYVPVSHFNKVESIHLLLCDCILEIATQYRNKFLVDDEHFIAPPEEKYDFLAAPDNGQQKNILVAFDRDGTLIHDDGYFGEDNDWQYKLKLYDGAVETIKSLNDFADVVVATNQIGVAKGMYGVERVREIHQYVSELLRGKGAIVDSWHFSPYVEKSWAIKEGLAADNPWALGHFPETRKPNIGMLTLAAADLGRELSSYKKIFVIGDKIDDLKMALNANGIGIWFYNGKNANLLEKAKELELLNPGKIFYATALNNVVDIIKLEIQKDG